MALRQGISKTMIGSGLDLLAPLRVMRFFEDQLFAVAAVGLESYSLASSSNGPT